MAYFETKVLDNQVKVLPTYKTVSGSTVTFNTDMTENLISCVADIVATGGGGTPTSPISIVGHSSCTIDRNGTTFTVSFGQTVYGGSVNLLTGLVNIDYGMKTYSGADNENWSEYSSYNGFYIPITDMLIGTRHAGIANEFITTFDSSHTINSCWFGVNSNRLFLIECADTTGSTVTDLKTWLSNNNLVVVYPLATPITIQANSVSITTINGTNNIFADTGDIDTLNYILSVGEALS